MKTFVCAALIAALAPFAWSAPNPLRVLPKTEILALFDRTDDLAAALKVWRDAYEQAGLVSGADDRLVDDCTDEVMALVFGLSEDGKTMSAKSITCVLTLPEDRAALISFGKEGTKCPKGFGWYVAVENPKVDLAALEALSRKRLKVDEKALVMDGEWLTIQPPADPAFVGWRAIDEGLGFAICANRAEADAAFANPTAPSGLLAEAFKAPNTQGPWARIVFPDVQALVDCFIQTPEDRQQLAIQAPGLDQLRTATLTASCTPDGTFRFDVVLTATDATHTQRLRDQLIAQKTLYGQMMLPMLTGLPDSKATDLIRRVAIGTEGNAVTLDFSLTPAEAIAAAKELRDASQKAKPTVTGTSGDPFEEDTLHFGDKP